MGIGGCRLEGGIMVVGQNRRVRLRPGAVVGPVRRDKRRRR